MSRSLQLSSIDAHALWADTYDHALNPLLSLERRYVERMLPEIAEMDVLDVACGTGRWLEELWQRGAASAVGFDVSSEMLRKARGKVALASRVVQADAMDMPLRAKSRDFAICSFGLGYIEDIGRFARELSRVLRRGGYLVLTDLHPDARVRGWKRSFRHGDTVVEVASFQRSIDKIREEFAKEGFEALECVEPAFGEAERPIFEKCGKAAVFDELVGQPAVMVLIFRLRRKSLQGPIPARSGTSTWLLGGHVALDAQTAVPANLEISGGRIQRVIGEYPTDADAVATMDLRNYLLLPGLINAHDHLEFNLFPRLGRGPYSNSADWARDIYHPKRSPVREHLSVPMAVRLWWGGLKNLLSGVTTVCHHNPWDETFEDGFPVQVLRRYGWAHSLTFGKNVLRAFSSTASSQPFIIHAGEGTDGLSADEVFELDRMSVLGPRTVLVHGVGFSKAGHALRAERDASLIWCPSSNRFVLGTTLNVQTIGNTDKVALGSDSALTARGSLLDEIRAAHEEGASPDLIFRMVTEAAASALLLRDGEGTLRPGAIANIIAIPWTSRTPAEALVQLNVSQVHLVMVSGQIQLAAFETRGLESIEAGGVRRWVRVPIRRLMEETAAHLGDEIHLAGMRISA